MVYYGIIFSMVKDIVDLGVFQKSVDNTGTPPHPYDVLTKIGRAS